MAMTRKAWSISGLAVELQVDRRTLASKIDQAGVKPAETGPAAQASLAGIADADGGAARYWMADVVAALHGKPGATDRGDLAAEKLRLAKANADRIERENAAAEGLLLSRDEVHAAVTAAFALVRRRLLELPTKIAPRAVGMSVAEIKNLIHREVYAALTDLSETKVVDSHQQPDGTEG